MYQRGAPSINFQHVSTWFMSPPSWPGQLWGFNVEAKAIYNPKGCVGVPLNGVCLQIVASAPLGIADCNDCSLKRPRGEIMWNHSTSASAEHVQKPCIANMTKISESFWVNPIHGTHLRLAEPVSCSTFPDRGPGLRSQLLHWLQLWSFAVLNPWQSFWTEFLKKSSANAEFF